MLKIVWLGLAATFAYNTAIAGLLTLLWRTDLFLANFIYSQCIGFSIALINTMTLSRMQAGWLRWAALALTLPASIVVGTSLAFWFSGEGSWDQRYVLQTLYVGLFFGIIASITSILFGRIGRLNREIEQRQRNLIESEKRQMEAQLKMLQAQIEPHFLFNTLANVAGLIDADPALAKQLLTRLNDWLRIALQRTRSEQTLLGDELDMLENYLQMLKIRFGDRLRWQVEADEAVRQHRFPPMLLQPLVENAVRHGIEPKLGGGEIAIHVHLNDTNLRIEVSDTGVGLVNEKGAGTGLANIRARLSALFGEQARLLTHHNSKGGVTAILELPR